MEREMMNTKEVAEYLDIHEKQVYALIKAKKIPCTRITGKWLFPKHLIDEWITSRSREGITPAHSMKKRDGDALLSAGSNDPILDILLNNLKQTLPGFYIFSCSTGSMDGLRLLSEELTDIAWCHLFDPESGEYNIPYVTSYLTGKKITVVHLFYREQGFLVSPESPHKIKEFKDLTLPGLKYINRQQGSGTRVLLDYNLEKDSIDSSLIMGYENEVYTHFEVGLALLSEKAHTGIATIAVARLFDLPFIPIVRESFDMVLAQSTFFQKGVQAFIETLNSEKFRLKVKHLGDYDFTESGKIIYSSS